MLERIRIILFWLRQVIHSSKVRQLELQIEYLKTQLKAEQLTSAHFKKYASDRVVDYVELLKKTFTPSCYQSGGCQVTKYQARENDKILAAAINDVYQTTLK